MSRAAKRRFIASYLGGRYGEALATGARGGLVEDLAVEALLHLDRPAEALERARGKRPDLALRADRPLRTELAGPTIVPYADDPLSPYVPTVPVTIDGQPVTAIVDTGGQFLVLGIDRAKRLGIRLVHGGQGRHGARRTSLATGIAEELRIGDAALANVPVAAMPSLQGAQDVVVIGTNILQRFCSTIDHPRRRLVLAPRGQSNANPAAARVPFSLWATHYMFARGGFGDRDGLHWFVDTGFIHVVDDDRTTRQAALYARPARRFRHGSLRLGPLTLDRPFVAPAPRRVPWASFGGVRIDGLVTFALLGLYSWTIDFDAHEYSFV